MALKPSEYRPFIKKWDKERYKDEFMNHPDRDRNAYRIYLPLNELDIKIVPNKQVKKEIEKQGYEIDDYIEGYAISKDKKRKMRIGKLLGKNPRAQKKFVNDPQRNLKAKDYMCVISRHPYDIAGMSTDRGWTSCMNLRTGSVNISGDIEHGTLVAYCIKKNDRNINKPSGRVLIKPYKTRSKKYKDVPYLGVPTTTYGEVPPGFIETVFDWVDNINSQHNVKGQVSFNIDGRVYNDGGDKINHINLKDFDDDENKILRKLAYI